MPLQAMWTARERRHRLVSGMSKPRYAVFSRIAYASRKLSSALLREKSNQLREVNSATQAKPGAATIDADRAAEDVERPRAKLARRKDEI